MLYPVWNVPHLGGALIIAGISIFHVIIAHFAVGAGILNVLTERRAIRHGDSVLLQFVRENSVFLIYLSFVAGAVSGVGIWFTIGVVAPEATTYLIRLFLWIWAIEWVFFLVELVSGYVYYYTWDRFSPKLHQLVGWIYAGAAYMSLVMINGILTFMLTPGDFVSSGALLDAWLNPSFWPSLFMRTVSALALAGIFVAIVASGSRKYNRDERGRIVAWGARFLLPLAFMPAIAFWYFSTVPPSARDLVLGGAVAMTFIFAFGIILSVLVAAYALFGMLRRARDINLETALLMAAIAFLATGSMEFVREGIRKPYVLHGIMYSHGILVNDASRLNESGILANALWVKPDTSKYPGTVSMGEAVYRLQCLRCHEINGYNAMTPLVRGWNREMMVTALNHLDKLKAFMPPFIGNETEKQALADYLLTLTESGLVPDNVKTIPDSVALARPHAEDSFGGQTHE